jgi:hypothetical protein
VVAALLAGPLFLLWSGLCLLPAGQREHDLAHTWAAALRATQQFAGEQLASLWGQGLLASHNAPWLSAGHPAWAMLWDLGFIAAWGYLLARIASRGFARLAGARDPSSPMPAWRWLGMAPLLAAGGDVAEDLLTWAALAAHGIDAGILAHACLWLTGLAALVKFAGLIACVPWIAVRCWIAFQPRGARSKGAVAA